MFGLVLYYQPRDQLETIPVALAQEGIRVQSTFGIQQALQEHQPEEATRRLVTWVRAEKITCLLWWWLPETEDVLRGLREAVPEIRLVLFNWDEPYVWERPHCQEWSKQCRFLDAVAATCESSLVNYRMHGSPRTKFTRAGCDAVKFHPQPEPATIVWDLVLICTNLYADKTLYPNQLVDRTRFLCQLHEDEPTLRIAVYGPAEFKDVFGDMYQGWCPYEKLPGVVNSAHVNLCTHVTCFEEGYLNERVGQILCSGSILYIDQIRGSEDILQDGVNCVQIHPAKAREQLLTLLADKPKMQEIKNSARTTGLGHFTWSSWAKSIAPLIKSVY